MRSIIFSSSKVGQKHQKIHQDHVRAIALINQSKIKASIYPDQNQMSPNQLDARDSQFGEEATPYNEDPENQEDSEHSQTDLQNQSKLQEYSVASQVVESKVKVVPKKTRGKSKNRSEAENKKIKTKGKKNRG